MIASDTPIRDILLPDSDRRVLIQAIVVVAIVAIAASVVRRERALVELVLVVGPSCAA